MRNLNLLKQFQTAQLPQLGVLTSVEQLTAFDMIYIYHHLTEGAEIELIQEHQHYLYANPIQVFFKGFKIGYLSDRVATLVANKLSSGSTVLATVKQLDKRKYLPLSGLDLELKFI